MSSLVPPPLEHDAPRRTPGSRIARIVVLLAVVALVATGTALWWKDRVRNGPVAGRAIVPVAMPVDSMARAPAGVRIKVRVINTTNTDGMAKRATQLLRDRGFDVVDYDGDSRKPLDSTLVQTHSGHGDWSERVIKALGAGIVESRPDSSRYLDLTVLIGRDWKPPTQPFRP